MILHKEKKALLQIYWTIFNIFDSNSISLRILSHLRILTRDQNFEQKLKRNCMIRILSHLKITCICHHVTWHPSMSFWTISRYPPYDGSLSKWRTFFSVTSKFSRILSKWRINDQKVRHFDKTAKYHRIFKMANFNWAKLSKWRTFSILVATCKKLTVSYLLVRLDVVRQINPMYARYVCKKVFPG